MVQMRIERAGQAIQVSLRLILSNASRAMLLLMFVSPAFASGCYVGGTQTQTFYPVYWDYSKVITVTVTVPENTEVCISRSILDNPLNFIKVDVTGEGLLGIATLSGANSMISYFWTGVLTWEISILLNGGFYTPEFYFPIVIKNNDTNTLSLTGMGGKIEPSGTSGGGNSTRTGYVSVLDAQTSQPKGGAVVRITVNVDTSSGGHDHGESYARRDRGSISGCAATDVADAYDCTTASNGSAQFTFNAPQASGTHSFTATCVNPICTNSGSGNIDVKVDGLATIPASQFYTFIGATDKHSDNHYLTSDAASQLWRLAATYYFKHWKDKTAVPLLYLNDASLVGGGKFDIKGNWVGDHKAHKRGTVIDIRANALPTAIPESLFTDFEKLAKDTILADGVTSAKAQLHCSTGFDPATNCVGDDNRHYHVILLGVDQ